MGPWVMVLWTTYLVGMVEFTRVTCGLVGGIDALYTCICAKEERVEQELGVWPVRQLPGLLWYCGAVNLRTN